MIYLVAFVASIVGAAIGGFAGGSLVAEVFVRLAKGPGDGGGNAMSGMVIGAPFGALAGMFVSFGSVVLWGGGSAAAAQTAFTLAGVVALAGLAVLVFSVVDYKMRRRVL